MPTAVEMYSGIKRLALEVAKGLNSKEVVIKNNNNQRVKKKKKI